MGRGYRDAGVLSNDELTSFASALDVLRGTLTFPRRGRPVTGFGLYAAVLDLGNNLGLAISTDGVGTKLLVAEELGRFDTVGIDCVAMNANDVVCVGAEPIAMVDYVAIASGEGTQLHELAVGLAEGARRARISIPGGETAQVPALLHAAPNAFDLAGTCVGTVAMDRIVDGRAIEPGDALVGLASSGLHSNGYTLARRVFRADLELAYEDYVAEFGRTLGEELLEPTAIYVVPAVEMLEQLDVRGLAHITGDGLLNLRRMNREVGFDLEFVPEPPAVFELIRRGGRVESAEMYRVFNMGVGFCVVVPEGDVDGVLRIAAEHGFAGWRLGTAVASPERRIRVLPLGLEGTGDHFRGR